VTWSAPADCRERSQRDETVERAATPSEPAAGDPERENTALGASLPKEGRQHHDDI